MSRIIEIENRYSPGCYPMRDIAIVRGEGAIVWDENGERYIDCVAGFGVANIGHANPYVIKAINERADKLITCPSVFYNDKRAELMKKLDDITPENINRFFFCNSGTEAVEGALKFVRLATGKTEFIAANRGFHGRTFGALSATWAEKYRKPFMPLVPGFYHVPYNNIEAIAEKINEKTAGVIVEIVQGEGGIHLGNKDYFLSLRKICDESKLILIFDEIQTGFGRTGRMFAYQHHNVYPDILCLAKSIAGGIPMGVVCFGDKIGEIPKGAHGSTFGGNPLVCAAALAAIKYIEDFNLPEKADELGKYFIQRLKEINSKLIREVRGIGLLIGIELKKRAFEYVRKLLNHKILANPAGPTVLRLMPPLVIKKDQIDEVIEKVEKVLKEDG